MLECRSSVLICGMLLIAILEFHLTARTKVMMELNSNLNYFDMTGGEGHTLFIGLSWEERCFLGAKEVYQRFNRMSNVYMFYNIHSSTDDNLNKSKINRYFSERHVEVTTIESVSYTHLRAHE